MKGEPGYRRIFVLGGARSGKSTFAERVAAELGGPVLYVATGIAGDAEMAERIRLHREQRPAGWRTVEEPVNVARATQGALGGARTVVFEDLTLLLSNLMAGPDQTSAEIDGLEVRAAEEAAGEELALLMQLPAHVVVVSNEVGLGLVPGNALGRAFRDALGRLNQAAAARADEVHFLVAGIPTRIKPPPR